MSLRARRGYSNQTGPHQFREYGRSRRRSSTEQTCSGALCGTILGFVFIIGSIIAQFVTEQNYIARYYDIKDIHDNVINMNNYNFFKSIKPSDAVYLTDKLQLSSNNKSPYDSVSNVEYKGYILHKEIEQYSWTEKKSTRKETSYDNEEERTVTTYDYRKKWTSKYHNSNRFKHPEGHYNPQNNQFMSSQNQPEYFYASGIKLGKYFIANSLKSMLNDNVRFNDITENVYNKHYKSPWKLKNGWIYYENNKYSQGYNRYSEYDEGYQPSPGEPNIGDVRIRFTGANLDGYTASFLGSVINGDELVKYLSKNKAEYVYLTVGREASIDEIIDSFHSENAFTLYLFRGLTLLFMMLGFVCCGSMANYIVSWIPLFGNLIGCALNCVAALVGVVFWLVFFAIAYLSARKEVAIGLIVIIIFGLFMMQKGANDKRKEGETKGE